MLNVKVSIVVPVYNVENYLSACLDSLINQTEKNIEIILVDDGSMDSSGDICDYYAKEDNRIKVIHRQNEGVSSAREVGIAKATGDFLIFVDADDYLALDFCEVLISVARMYNVDWVGTNMTEVGGESYLSFPQITDSRVVNNVRFHIDNYIKHYFYTLVICGKLYRRELFDNYHFQRLKIGEDSCCMIDMILKANRTYLLNYNGYYYVNHDGGVTKSKSFNKNEYDRYRALKYIYEKVSFSFPNYGRDLCDSKMNKLVSVYQKNICFASDREKKELKRVLLKEFFNTHLNDKNMSIRMKVHIILVRYFRLIYDLMIKINNLRGKHG